MRKSVRAAIGVVAALAVLGPIGYLFADSLVPSTYDMAAMGVADFGGGPPHAHGSGALSVTSLTGPTTGAPDVAVTLTARKEKNRYTLNGTTPGPEIRAVRGQLVQVTLVNDNITDGITLHWHGVDVPNAEDGVAGITQDAVSPGQNHVYRFVVQDAGTYWYHSHQVSHEQVRGGLFGALVVLPGPLGVSPSPGAGSSPAASPSPGATVPPAVAPSPGVLSPGADVSPRSAVSPAAGLAPAGLVAPAGLAPAAPAAPAALTPAPVAPAPVAVVPAAHASSPPPASGTGEVDPVLAVHTYDGRRTINGAGGVSALAAAPGQTVRARLINTDAGPIRVWVSGAPFQVAAVDGRDVHSPPDVTDKAVLLTAGGRVDLRFTVPASGGVRVDVGGGVAQATGSRPASAEPRDAVDLLAYGAPAPLGFDPARASRVFDYRIGRRIGFLDGKPGMWWTINGHLFPDVPMFMVKTGDIVRMKIVNTSGEVHPMHLHGHHAVVLSRNGVAATGSPWWIDSLDVGDDETYEIAFIADNPGIWVDHCHNLKHAVDGLLAHLTYEGVTTPYRVGGKAGNSPE